MTEIKRIDVIEDDNYNETATLDVTRLSYCQSCAKDFSNFEIVFYAHLDNNIICRNCIEAHSEVEARLYLKK